MLLQLYETEKFLRKKTAEWLDNYISEDEVPAHNAEKDQYAHTAGQNKTCG
jgi:hypothetical protein